MLGFQTLACLHDIPVVRSSTDKLQDVYSKAKDKSALIRHPCKAVESIANMSYKVANTVANPLIKPLSKPVRAMDNYAVQKIRQIKSKYPVINTPTEEVMNTFSDRTEPVRNVVSSVKDTTTTKFYFGKQIVADAKEAIVNKACDVANYAFSFCEAHVPGFQQLCANTKQKIGNCVSQTTYLFNRSFQSAKKLFILFRLLITAFLCSITRVNDWIIAKIHNIPFLRLLLQRPLISINLRFNCVADMIRPEENERSMFSSILTRATVYQSKTPQLSADEVHQSIVNSRINSDHSSGTGRQELRYRSVNNTYSDTSRTQSNERNFGSKYYQSQGSSKSSNFELPNTRLTTGVFPESSNEVENKAHAILADAGLAQTNSSINNANDEHDE